MFPTFPLPPPYFLTLSLLKINNLHSASSASSIEGVALSNVLLWSRDSVVPDLFSVVSDSFRKGFCVGVSISDCLSCFLFFFEFFSLVMS